MKPSIKVGVEWEFYHSNPLPNIEGVESEYYTNMGEINNFLSDDLKTTKDIYEYLTKVVEQMKSYSKKYEWDIKTNFWTTYRNSVASNGVHLHISQKIPEGQRKVTPKQLYDTILAFKEPYPSFRSVFSHHIWGAERQFQSDWKRALKRCVVNKNRTWNTLEIRILDCEDLLVIERRKKLASMLGKLFFRKIEDKPSKIFKNIVDELNARPDHHNVKTACRILKLEKQNGGRSTCYVDGGTLITAWR